MKTSGEAYIITEIELKKALIEIRACAEQEKEKVAQARKELAEIEGDKKPFFRNYLTERENKLLKTTAIMATIGAMDANIDLSKKINLSNQNLAETEQNANTSDITNLPPYVFAGNLTNEVSRLKEETNSQPAVNTKQEIPKSTVVEPIPATIPTPSPNVEKTIDTSRLWDHTSIQEPVSTPQPTTPSIEQVKAELEIKYATGYKGLSGIESEKKSIEPKEKIPKPVRTQSYYGGTPTTGPGSYHGGTPIGEPLPENLGIEKNHLK